VSDYITKSDLRRAWQAGRLLLSVRSEIVANVVLGALDAALAALDAEQPKACVGFKCHVDQQGCLMSCPGAPMPYCVCRCGQPYSAHQQQEQPDPLASKDHGIAQQEQAQQPAPAALPELAMWKEGGE
jgi:hypothetical protein